MSPALRPVEPLVPRAGRPPRLHLDPIGGMAGDMFLAACLDLGAPLPVVTGAIEALGLRGISIETWAARRGGRAGTRLRVLVDGESLEDDASGDRIAAADWDLIGLLGLLRASALPEPVRARAARMFRRLAVAWARSAAVPITAVRFADGPGLDFLVDLVGAAALVEHLGARVTCGPVFLGEPEPPALVASLLSGLDRRPPPDWWRTRSGAGQCLTPTGATLLAELVDEWVDGTVGAPGETVREGWGLGAKEQDDRPNALRARLLG